MDILSFHNQLITNYREYIRSFLNIKDARIAVEVNQGLEDKKLWPEPLIQFNPGYEKGNSFSMLSNEGIIHNELEQAFGNYNLYKHQEEAIRLGHKGNGFVVTSGTGSGKSLTYLATIFDYIFRNREKATDKIQAVIVYPMNALINSQFEEIKKYKEKYEEKHGKNSFPVTFGQYTGQEKEDVREQHRLHPPNILLTNYMMLELLMTRGGENDRVIRKQIEENCKFLVFDELHTYRGRQGADVSFLIRRIKSGAKNKITCIGTSATMVASDETSIKQQKDEVAKVASTIFGEPFTFEHIIQETLESPKERDTKISVDALSKQIIAEAGAGKLNNSVVDHPFSSWLRNAIAVEQKEGQWVRRKPLTAEGILDAMANVLSLDKKLLGKYFDIYLKELNNYNAKSENKTKVLPFRLHQFIAQTGSVYATLGNQTDRQISMDAGLYLKDTNTKIFPLVFSRGSGHEFYCVRLNYEKGEIQPYDFFEVYEEEDEETIKDGYLFIQHAEDEETLFDLERDKDNFPDAWFNAPKKDGTRTIRKQRLARLPRLINFNSDGAFSETNVLKYQAWFVPKPMLYDPTSGVIFQAEREWRKVMKLGGEGRSTATTVLSFETIKILRQLNLPVEFRKLLSFTDNRQDASLQAGHFNDFVKVIQLRSAICSALSNNGTLDYSIISDKVFDNLGITQEEYAKNPSEFPMRKKDNEDIFKKLLMYRLLHDLRRGWRVVLPNLEQTALVRFEYKGLLEACKMDNLWNRQPLLAAMNSSQRYDFIIQILEYFRKAFAINFSLLLADQINQNQRKFIDELKFPWQLDEGEELVYPKFMRVEPLASQHNPFNYDSLGYQSAFSRFIRRTAMKFDLPLTDRATTEAFTYNLLDLLKEGGYLASTKVKNQNKTEVNVYQLDLTQLLWVKSETEEILQDEVRTNRMRNKSDNHKEKANKYFRNVYQTKPDELKDLLSREHTGQIQNEDRQEREKAFREGKLNALYCSPTMELGVDISELAVVHMRNVPPSPANYAQRSGRAGRSGQAALVMTYCSNFSPHDRHYFRNSAQMVSGSVIAPRMDLINKDLILSHLHAIILSYKSLESLNNSIGNIIDADDPKLPLKENIQEAFRITVEEEQIFKQRFKIVLEDDFLKNEIIAKQPGWLNDEWIVNSIRQFGESFDQSFTRWRTLFNAAQQQIQSATATLNNKVYGEDHDLRKEAKRSLYNGVRQRDLLLNTPPERRGRPSKNIEQSEFYPFRYLASEGFLPGYNFTRLPLRAFLQTANDEGEFISRPRFTALNEFGPSNIIYHNGSKYKIDKLILGGTAEYKPIKISPHTGYLMMNDQLTYNVDPITQALLTEGMDDYYHPHVLEMTESRAYQMQRINCQEEERTRKGYEIKTHFYVEDNFLSATEASIHIDGLKLLHIHHLPAAKLVQMNFKWRTVNGDGFPVNLKSGAWLTKKDVDKAREEGKSDDVKNIKLYTTDTANALYIQPIAALGLSNNPEGVITLMYALKRAIESHFQVESNEIGATITGNPESPNILLYEASEGSLGVLSQIVENSEQYAAVMREAYRICYYKNGQPLTDEELATMSPATYDDLLSYYNQHQHSKINRMLIRDALTQLMAAEPEVSLNRNFPNYEQHYNFLQTARDQNSSTEDNFLKFLYKKGIRLPDEAQPKVKDLYVRPDFFYKPNIFVFCDGTPHNQEPTRNSDTEKRMAIRNDGYQVLNWNYKQPLEEFVKERPDVFVKVK